MTYLLDSSTHYILCWRTSKGVRVGEHGLLDEPVPEQAAGAAGAPVEAERELVEVVVEVLGGLTVVEGSGEPALEE